MGPINYLSQELTSVMYQHLQANVKTMGAYFTFQYFNFFFA